MMKTLFALVLCASSVVAQAPTAKEVPDRRDATMQNLMDSYAKRHHGKVALYAKQLRTGAEAEINADTPVGTASVIKVAILLESMYQVKAGKISLEDMLPLKKEDQVSGSGVLFLFHTPAQVNFETALTLMITQSDNTATNLVLDHVGRENVNNRMRALGFPLTTSVRKISRPGSGDNSPELKPFGIGRTTAREMAHILMAIDRCDLGAPELCKKMINMFENQFWRNSIPHFLEDVDTTEVPSHVANKTGSLDAVRNDVGIVYTKDGPIVVSVFTWANQDQTWRPENEAEILIAHMAKTIVDGWAPNGLGDEKR
jgi:beta-lactamase class A